MINAILRALVRLLLALRYRVRVVGLERVAARGRDGILFLPNHPALVDPIILLSRLHGPFGVLTLADRNQVNRFFIRTLARRAGVVAMPSAVSYGRQARGAIEQALDLGVRRLCEGGCFLMYPSGRNHRTRLEDLGGNSAAHRVLQAAPNARVVLVRTVGLWGSKFSWAWGRQPDVGATIKWGVRRLLANLIFFTPRRRVTIELLEPDDLPRQADRAALNRYLENFYNAGAAPNTFVPYSAWGSRHPVVRPEPFPPRADGSPEDVSPATRELVKNFLAELSGVAAPADADRLANELGLDSLARLDLLTWLHREFGFPQGDTESLETVGDVMLAAAGRAVALTPPDVKPPSPRWRARPGRARRVRGPSEDSLPAAFLRRVAQCPGAPAAADNIAGTITRRRMLTVAMALREPIARIEGNCVGIMLPASVAADAAYMAVALAGKTPLLVNWTVGRRNILHALEALGVRRVLTAAALKAKLESDGMDMTGLSERLTMLEDIRAGLSRGDRLRAALAARFPRRLARRLRASPTAAVLMTSGSESLPKLVPLTHANILSDMGGVLDVVDIRTDDILLSMLPPFHSFGLTVGLAMPLCAGLRAVHHASPTEGLALARLVEAYRATLLVGTPTFLDGLVRSAAPGQLDSLQLAVTGAETCPPRLYEALRRACPRATVLEGYGVTECSPVVSVNDPAAPQEGTIGKVLPIFEHAVADLEGNARVPAGQTGMLLVRGPAVFGGYIGASGAEPFEQFEGRQWYRTGDLVSEDPAGVLTFRGRLKRFIKLGGEMISLGAIEAVLVERFAAHLPADAGPALAVEATPGEPPQIVLLTRLDVSRQAANDAIRQSGLSGLHNIRQVVKVEAIPVLGTGKTDYRALRERLAGLPA